MGRDGGVVKTGLAVAAAVVLLAGCGGGGDEGSSGAGESAGGGVPEGFKSVEAGWLTFAVPEDWISEDYGEEDPSIATEELVGPVDGEEGDYVLSSVRVVPFEGTTGETEAMMLASKTAAEVRIGNQVDDMEREQEFEVAGAQSSARNDYNVDPVDYEYFELDEITDVFVVNGDGEAAYLRLIVSDDNLPEEDREKVLESMEVTG